MINYDYDIRETYEYAATTPFYNIIDNINDYDMLRLGTEILRLATDRLNSDLNNPDIKREYNRLTTIILMLERIIKDYV